MVDEAVEEGAREEAMRRVHAHPRLLQDINGLSPCIRLVPLKRLAPVKRLLLFKRRLLPFKRF